MCTEVTIRSVKRRRSRSRWWCRPAPTLTATLPVWVAWVALWPLTAPTIVIRGIVDEHPGNTPAKASSPETRATGGELNQLLFNMFMLATPGIVVLAWYTIWAFHLPPHGPAGRWVAFALAYLFGVQQSFTTYFVALSFAMDGSDEVREPVTRPVRFLLLNAIGVASMTVFVSAPLIVGLVIAGLLT